MLLGGEERTVQARRVPSSASLDACPCAGVSLDKLVQPAILTILAEGGLHGYRIVQRIADLERHRPDATGVYRSLRAMEKRGLVTSAWDVSGTGPAKKSYVLTEAGRDCLERWIETLERHRQAIGCLLVEARRASARRCRTSSRARSS
jgi:poly-beta-hydroxybutyrate-responsive repressor